MKNFTAAVIDAVVEEFGQEVAEEANPVKLA
jgi:hypothetical protein